MPQQTRSNPHWITYTTDASVSSATITWAVDSTATTPTDSTITWADYRALFAQQVYSPTPAWRELPPEEVAANRARNRAAAIERERACERARLLLLESLTGHQLESFRMNGRFDVATLDKSGRPRLFRLTRGRVGNVLELDARGNPIRRFCVHPSLDCPDEDTMLAQKLWLENDPDGLLAIANRHPV